MTDLEVLIECLNNNAEQAVERDSELIVEAANENKAILRLWQNSQCLVVGRAVTRWSGYRRAKAMMAAEGWPVITRASGGTIVPHGAGVLNVSYIYQPAWGKRSFTSAYQALCGPLVAAFQTLGLDAEIGAVPGAYCDGEFNIRIDGKKVVGTAQRWKSFAAGESFDPSESETKNVNENSRVNVVLVHASICLADAAAGVAAANRFLVALEGGGGVRRAPFELARHTDLKTELGLLSNAKQDDIDLPQLIQSIAGLFEANVATDSSRSFVGTN